MSSGSQSSTIFPTCQLAEYTNYGNENTSMVIQGNEGIPINKFSPLKKSQAEPVLLSNQPLNVLDHSQISNLTTNNFHDISESQILDELNSSCHSSLCATLNNISSQNLVLEQRDNIDTRYHRQRGSATSLPDLESPLTSVVPVIPQTGYLNSLPSCHEPLRLRGSSEEPYLLGLQNTAVGNKYFGQDNRLNKTGVIPGRNIGLDVKDHKLEATPAWSELKTKAGKERKRLPLACAACRRKKIRCSGEKPACKHCLRSRIPCIYKVTTRKATPRTDYMGILGKRIKRMEERIFKIMPREVNDSPGNPMLRAIVKPKTSQWPTRNFAGRKRLAEEAFGLEFQSWLHCTPAPRLEEESERTKSISKQKAEELKLLSEGVDELPSKEIQQHLAEVFFENIEGQAYYLLHKPSFMKKLGSNSIPPVLVLAVCAIAARFSTHPQIKSTPNFLRGEKWAAESRSIVMRRYEWPDITIVTCLLILSLHEFGTCQGVRSWFFGGMAIRMAFTLNLHRDLDHDPATQKKLSFIDQEIRKRLMWTCFIMDILNYSCSNRPNFLSEEIINLSLPIKDRDFYLNIAASTDYSNEENLLTIPSEKDSSQAVKLSMSIAAHLIRAMALWGRVNHYVNSTEYPQYQYPTPQTDSMYKSLNEEINSFDTTLPESLKYTSENLSAHNAEGFAKQFLLLHICLQQNILCLNKVALVSLSQHRSHFVGAEESSTAVLKSFEAADKISELLKDGGSCFIMAPIIGYCAFFASTVHILGAFSKNPLREAKSKMNLATNVNYLSKIKKFWGIFSWMLENLKEQYKRYADLVSQENDTSELPNNFLQFSDWIDIYPHGIPTSELDENSAEIKKEPGADGSFGDGLGVHTSEKEDLLHAPSTIQSSENRGSKRKLRKPPPTPLITKPVCNEPIQSGLNSHNAPQPYNQISPITPVNMYHQQPFYNPSYLFPDYQQSNVSQLNGQLVVDSFGSVQQATGAFNMMESPSWDVTMSEKARIDLSMLNYSTEPNSLWMLPYNNNSTEFIHEQNMFDPNNCMEPDSSRWQ